MKKSLIEERGEVTSRGIESPKGTGGGDIKLRLYNASNFATVIKQ